MQITDELRVLVEAEVERAIRDLEIFDDSLKKSEKSAGKLGDALKAMEKKALVLSGLVTAAGTAAVKFAGENEKLKVSLENLLGSAEEAGRVFKEWRELGSSPGLSIAEVEAAGKALLALGEDAGYATRIMTRLGNVAAGTGASFSAVSDSYEKVRAQGKLSERDLNQFQRQGIPIVKALADTLNKSEEEVKSLVAAGKVGFPEMENAFASLTEAGGKFEGAMEKLSGTTLEKFGSTVDAGKQALASFGELLLPMVNGILDSANSLFEGLQNMDEGTKRFVLGFAGVVAISGPAIAAIKGISLAMTAMMANPWMLAIAGTIAAAGAVAGLVNKQANAYKDLKKQIAETDANAKSLLNTFADGNNEKVLDKKTTEDLIKLYPELTGVIKANTTTVAEAARAQANLSYQKRRDLEYSIRAAEVARLQKQLEEVDRQITMLNNSIGGNRDAPARGTKNDGKNKTVEDLEKWEARHKELIAQIFALGKESLDSAGTYDLGLPKIDTGKIEEAFTPPASSAGALKKTWQEWYSEITKVDLKAITMQDQGEALGQLFIDSLSNTQTLNQNLAEALANEFDMAGALRGQKDNIERALRELLTISPSEINDPFTFKDKFIEPLAAQFKDLDREIKNLDALKTIEELQKKIDDFNKTEWELAKQAALDNGFTEEHAKEIARLTKKYAELSNGVASFKDIAEETFKNLALDISNIAFDGILKGLNDVGAAFAKGENSAAAFKEAMHEMCLSILSSLPTMFLQAGLRLIMDGQWPLGLGFIAAAGSTALIDGYVRGRIEDEKEAATVHARGNVFDKEIIAFAKGGAFTNQIVTAPAYFRHGGGLGVMGEAGPEAVMPLKRLPNGDLGVQAQSGGGAQVTVYIINNTNTEVHTEEKADAYGNVEWDITIGKFVDGHIASGKADRVMGARFGLRAQGV